MAAREESHPMVHHDRFSALEHCRITVRDGEAGRLVDLYFDDQGWTVRYLVVQRAYAGVLISPISIDRVDPASRSIAADLTQAQIEGSPRVDTAKPVSRQHEVAYATYLGLPFYWRGPFRWGLSPVPTGLRQGTTGAAGPLLDTEVGDSHLRSVRGVHGYTVLALDGGVGHVADVLVDRDDWTLHYLVVDAHRFWPHRYAILSTDWAGPISWEGRSIRIDVGRDAVRQAPAFDPSAPLTRAEEEGLFRHYRRRPYWEHPAEDWRRPGVAGTSVGAPPGVTGPVGPR